MPQQQQLTDFESMVLIAVVEGYRAREGLKDRMRALNEWEIARRSGFTELSYAEFLEHPSRDQMGAALSALQRLGLVGIWERGIKYDSFLPTPAGERLASATTGAGEGSKPAPVSEPGGEPIAQAGPAPPAQLLQRLDEIIRLLHSIDRKLGGS